MTTPQPSGTPRADLEPGEAYYDAYGWSGCAGSAWNTLPPAAKDGWRHAEQTEAEVDRLRAALAEAERRRDEWESVAAWNNAEQHKANARAEQAERERDEAKKAAAELFDRERAECAKKVQAVTRDRDAYRDQRNEAERERAELRGQLEHPALGLARWREIAAERSARCEQAERQVREIREWARRFRVGDVIDPEDLHDLSATLSGVSRPKTEGASDE